MNKIRSNFSKISKIMLRQLLLMATSLAISLQLNAQMVNWATDIAPILYQHCVQCHNGDGVGGFSLVGYPAAYTQREAILEAVTTKQMPPWKADPTYTHFAGENVLTDNEIADIAAWVNANGPSGDLAQAPEEPVIVNGLSLGFPDLMLETPAYTMTGTTDEYRCFVVPTGLTQTAFLRALDAIPGNHLAVHHILIYEDLSGQGEALDAQTPEPGYLSFGGPGFSGARLVGSWVPGAQALVTPPFMGIKLNAGADLIVQVHFPAAANGMTEKTELNLYFTPSNSGIRELTLAPLLNHSGFSLTNGPLFIPANTIKEFHAQLTIPQNGTLLAAAPHMHLLGQNMVSFGVTPQNDTIKFIRIPKWDFHWQGGYMFQRPLKVPTGTKLHAYATYDNTANNPNNPSFPPQDVSVGEATTDEMMLVYFLYTGYQNGDEDIILDSTLLASGAYTVPAWSGLTAVSIAPNPVRDRTLLQWSLTDESTDLSLTLTDQSGKTLRYWPVEHFTAGKHNRTIDLLSLPSGQYWLTMTNERGQRATVSLMKE
jgi:mono/diheme cytochrome c family protein